MSNKNKKSKQPPKSFRLDNFLGVSTNVAVGPLGFRAELHPQDENLRPAQVLFRDKGDDPGFSALETPGTPELGVDCGGENRDTRLEEYIGKTQQEDRESIVVSTEKGKGSGVSAMPADTTKKGAGGFGRLRAALEAIRAVSGGNEETVPIRNKIENLLPLVDTIEARFATRPDNIEDQRHRFELINKFKGVEGPLLRHADHFQVGEDVFEVLEDLQDIIHNYQTVYQTAVQVEECRVMDPAEASVLNNFRCAQEAEYRHGNRKGCLRGTRRAILDEIELWSRDFDKLSLYWLNGLAGTGKSTIAQTIAERLFADGRLGASFFCSRDFEDRSDLRFIFPTLAVQLAQRYTEFRSIFVPLVRSDSKIAYESLYDQMNKLIVRPLVKSAISTVIVIDALDECKDEEPASAILSVLGQFVSQIPKVKFFLTGRPEPRILEGFRLPLLVPVADLFVLHDVEPSRVSSDIRLFFGKSFSELAARRYGLDDWPGEETLDLLCRRSAGLFVHAVATARFIDHRNRNPKKQLDRLLQTPESSALEGKTKFNTDKTLDSLYMSILQGAFGDDDPDGDPQIRSVLGAVALAVNPLSPSSIATLLGLDIGDVLPLLSSTHSLLILHEDVHRPVQPFHKSFPDFIVDTARCADPRFRICPAAHHTELVVGCLELLNRQLEQNMCGLPDGVINSEVDDLKERVERYVDRTLEYACRSWHKHLLETIPTRKPDITSALHRFLEQKLLFWLEVLSVLGAAREAVDALETVGKWLDESPTLDLVDDCSRFVISFFELINTSAPHIYHSAIFLSPRKSIVRRLYESYARPLARVVRGLPTSWEPTVATIFVPQLVAAVAWSPCGRFIAVGCKDRDVIEILDATTLGRIKTLTRSPNGVRLLRFSPDGCLLTGFGDDWELTSWDLQTGGQVCTIPSEPRAEYAYYRSSTHSADGKTVAIAYSTDNRDLNDIRTYIRTYNLVSREHMYTHQALEGCAVPSVWTHGERLRFAAVKPGCHITIWEAEFTSIHTLTEVETLPLPDEVSGGWVDLFHPTLYRIVLLSQTAIMVWDARDSKFLLDSKTPCSLGDFSPDGRFLAYETDDGPFIWKDSPNGYVLHQGPILAETQHVTLSLSLYGESIVVNRSPTIHLLHTTAPLPSIPNEPVKRGDFILRFSTDQTLAMVAREYENTITIFDLQSGEPRFTIDAGMEVLGMRIIGSAVVVVGDRVVTWDLPTGDHARANTEDIVQTTPLGNSIDLSPSIAPVSISPDLNYIAMSNVADYSPIVLYDMPARRHLARGDTTSPWMESHTLWFTPDAREVWCGNRGHSLGWTIMKGNVLGAVKLEPIDPGASPSGGFPWESPHGYEVLDDEWVLSPGRKRLLWLPHNWRSDGYWSWGGRFLGLFHGTLREAVILEFYE